MQQLMKNIIRLFSFLKKDPQLYFVSYIYIASNADYGMGSVCIYMNKIKSPQDLDFISERIKQEKDKDYKTIIIVNWRKFE